MEKSPSLFPEFQNKIPGLSGTSAVVTLNTVMRRLATGITYEKCVVRRFRRCANVIECSYTNLESLAHYTPRVYGRAYCL